MEKEQAEEIAQLASKHGYKSKVIEIPIKPSKKTHYNTCGVTACGRNVKDYQLRKDLKSVTCLDCLARFGKYPKLENEFQR
jgi:hypothetical protein